MACNGNVTVVGSLRVSGNSHSPTRTVVVAAAAVMAAEEEQPRFSKECPPKSRVTKGRNNWWGVLLIANTGADKDQKPWACALGCGHTYSINTPNAFKIGGHIVGDECRRHVAAEPLLAVAARIQAFVVERIGVLRQYHMSERGIFCRCRWLKGVAIA